jgi:hypothetical protein
MRFCMLSRNKEGKSLVFDPNIRANIISCVSLFGNSCSSSGDYRGLVYIGSTLTLSNCAFLANSFDAFLGGCRCTETGRAVFNRCVFDFPLINRTCSVLWSATQCTVAPNAVLAVSFDACPWQDATPMRARSPSRTRSPTRAQTRTPNQNLSVTRTQSPNPAATETPLETETQSSKPTGTQMPRATEAQAGNLTETPPSRTRSRSRNQTPTISENQTPTETSQLRSVKVT